MPTPKFRYSHYDLKVLRAGAVIEVSLNAVNNIKLMTPPNFQRFKELLDYKFLGGVAKKSPVRFTIPETGHWHLVIDSDGHAALAESSVKMIGATVPNVQRSAAPAPKTGEEER